MRPVNKVDIFVGDAYAGSLERTASGCAFRYALDYLAQGGPAAASTLPLTPEAYEVHGVNLPTFFANLLPEGLRLDAIAAKVKTSRDDRLSLLVASGNDAIGDVSVRAAGRKGALTSPSVDPATDTFRKVFDARYGLNSRSSERVSIAGVQEKLSASRFSAPMLVKNRAMPEAIVKLNFDQEKRPCLIENERFFMEMAKDCGLTVAETELIFDREGETALLVTRFDRIVRQKRTVKLHQEDACQFLDIYPDHKYDVPFQEIARGLQSICTAPIPDILRLIELYAFSYLIANGDLHAKNISVIRMENGVTQLSPAYDLLSTLPYQDRTMALKLDGRDSNFKAARFISFGERFGVREKAVRTVLTRLYEASEPWIGRLGEIGFEDRLANQLATTLKKRRHDLVS